MNQNNDHEQYPKTKEELIQEEIAEALTEGELQREETREQARRRLQPTYEIRIAAKTDPIVEETRLARQLGVKPDDKYDRYMERAGESESDSESGR